MTLKRLLTLSRDSAIPVCLVFTCITVLGCVSPTKDMISVSDRRGIEYFSQPSTTQTDTNQAAPNSQEEPDDKMAGVLLLPFYKIAADNHFRPRFLDMGLWDRRIVFHRGWACFKRKEWDNALIWFQENLVKYRYLPDYTLLFMGVCMENKGEFKCAADLFSSLIGTYHEGALFSEAMTRLADMYFCLEEYEKAAAQYERCLKFIAPNQESYIRYQIGLCNLFIDPEYARMNFSILVNKRPESEFSALAKVYIKRFHEYKKDEGLAALPGLSAEDELQEAKRLYKNTQYNSSIKALNALIQKNPEKNIQCQALYYLAKNYKQLGEKDMAIQMLEESIKIMPKEQCTAEARFFLARILWNKHRNREALWHLKYLYRHYPLWDKADECLYIMGRIEEEKEGFSEAIRWYKRIVKDFKGGAFYSKALWRVGWSYYSQGYYKNAASHFENYTNSLNDEALSQKFSYWKARALEMIGRWTEADNIYKAILNKEYWSFYSGLAEIRLGLNLENQTDLNHYNNISHHYHSALTSPYFVKLYDEMLSQDAFAALSKEEDARISRIWELWLLGLKNEAVREIRYNAFSKKDTSPHLLYALSLLAHLCEEYEMGVRIGIKYKNTAGKKYKTFNETQVKTKACTKDHEDKGKGTPESDKGLCKPGNILIYPPGFLTQIKEKTYPCGLDPLIVLSLIRQESLFDTKALSSASAYGLMQVIPPTGRLSAKELKIDFPLDINRLFEPDLNLTLGCFYLNKVLERFDHNLVFALAAYNAGPGAVNRWQKRFSECDMDEFIENISYGETREYVMRVMRNYWIYRKLSSMSRQILAKPNLALPGLSPPD